MKAPEFIIKPAQSDVENGVGSPEAFGKWHRAAASPVGATNGHLRRGRALRAVKPATGSMPQGHRRKPHAGWMDAPARSPRRRKALRRENLLRGAT